MLRSLVPPIMIDGSTLDEVRKRRIAVSGMSDGGGCGNNAGAVNACGVVALVAEADAAIAVAGLLTRVVGAGDDGLRSGGGIGDGDGDAVGDFG